MSAMNQATPIRIAIIGGGAAGLAAARVFTRKQRTNVQICVLEQDGAVGGVWNHDDAVLVPKVRPMYQNLRTNLPKEIMAYREFPWRSRGRTSASDVACGLDTEDPTSFVTHSDVAHYLRAYCSHFHLERYVHKGCRVDQLTRVPDTTSRLSSTHGWNMIRLDWTSTQPNERFSDIFDAVIVCNGHYNTPAVPTIPGLENYKGQILHSIAYNVPDTFANQTVLCIGGRASGSDIAREISAHATTVYLSDTAFVGHEPVSHDNVTWVPKTTNVTSDGRVAFAPTRQEIEPVHVDTIIFCSGYDYSYPFINARSNMNFETSQRRVQPLFEQLWHAEHANLAFIGLPHSVVPFPLFEFQAEAVERSWCDETSVLGDRERLRSGAHRDAHSGGALAGRVPHDTHFLGAAQWDYCRRMAAYAGLLNRQVEDYIAANQSIYDHATLARKEGFIAAADLYRQICYQRNDEQHSFTHFTHTAR